MAGPDRRDPRERHDRRDGGEDGRGGVAAGAAPATGRERPDVRPTVLPAGQGRAVGAQVQVRPRVACMSPQR